MSNFDTSVKAIRMKTLPIDLMDLVPQDSPFKLSTRPEETFTLCRWSLRVRSWAVKQYGAEGLQTIFNEQRIQEISEMAWFMLKEKDKFPPTKELTPFECFQESITTVADQLAVIKALLAAVGIGEPEIDKIQKAIGEGKIDPNALSPKLKKKTGAKSSTP